MNIPGVVEFDGPSPEMANEKRVPLKTLLEQHRRTYKLQTHLGLLVLRRLRQFDLEAAIIRLAEKMDGYESLQREGQELYERSQSGGLEAKDMERFHDLEAKLYLLKMEMALACFVEPEIKTVEEFDAISANLTLEERDALYKLMAELSNPHVDVDLTPLEVAGAFGVKPPSDLNVENMTSQQYGAMVDTIEANAKAQEVALKRASKK